MTVLVLIFGEVLPKTLAITYPEPVATRVAPIIRVLIILFSPVVTVVRLLVRGILHAFGVRGNEAARMTAIREEIAGTIALGHSEGAVEKEARDRLLGALDLTHRTVDEIMRHRRQIEMIDATTRRRRSSRRPSPRPIPASPSSAKATRTSLASSTQRTSCARWTG